MNIEWKPVYGWEDYYEVSNTALVRRIKGGARTRFMRQLTGTKTAHGYMNITLSREGKCTKYYIHRLVAMAFIPNPERKPQINHIDGNGFNNTIANLEWATARENLLHRSRILRKEIGESHHAATLSNTQLPEIRKLLNCGLMPSAVARKMRVSRGVIKGIKSGRTWRYV
jgi:hypothetical protein